MKIIFLNAWGGTEYDALAGFIETSAASTDFFCLQEVFDGPRSVTLGEGLERRRSMLFAEIGGLLPGFQGFSAPAVALTVDGVRVTEGLAVFSKKTVTVRSHGDLAIYKNDHEPHAFERLRNLQYVRFSRGAKDITLCNFHGIAYPGEKLDTPARLEQSRRIVEFLGGEAGEKIVGGDFNLMPDTESVAMIESAGMRNLIKDFHISSTRSDISYERHRNNPPIQHFADFAFTSPGISVKRFEVPRMDVSDHLPLILDCD